MATKFGQK